MNDKSFSDNTVNSANVADRVSMAVVGLTFGQLIATKELLKGPGYPFVELKGVCDLDADKAEAFGHTHALKAYPSLDAILADPAIEAVGLFTPPKGRAELIRRIIHAGKHVMTTKPFELDASAAQEVLIEAHALNRTVHLNSPAPLPPQLTAQMLAWQQEHRLGQVVSFRCDAYVRKVETADGSWYDDPERCPVAPIFRLGIYGLNEMIRLCTPVTELCVAHSRILTGRPTPDTAALHVKFANGGMGSLFVSFCIDDGVRYGNLMEVHYEHGSIFSRAIRSGGYGTSGIALNVRAMTPDGEPLLQTCEFFDEALPGEYQWEAFYQAVRSGKGCVEGEIKPDAVAHAVAIIQAMRKAQMTNTWVTL